MSQLKIVSWNIWGGKNLIDIIELLRKADADIIGLQEVLQDEGGNNNHAKTIADALGYKWTYSTTTVLTPGVSHLLKELGIEKNMEWGNAVLSKRAITDSKTHLLSETHKRIALEATIRVKDKDLHIFSTHLIYTFLQPSEIQVAQVENLLKVISKESTVVMGDFNAIPESETIKKMGEVMVNTESDSTKFTWGLYPEKHPESNTIKQKLDYIFTTRDIMTVSSGTMDSKASDHLPVYAVITI